MRWKKITAKTNKKLSNENEGVVLFIYLFLKITASLILYIFLFHKNHDDNI